MGTTTGLAGLDRLGHQVEAAAREIERLRRENRRLAERLAALDGLEPLAEAPALAAEVQALHAALGGGPPDALRATVARFLEALEVVLAHPDFAHDDAPTPDTPLDFVPDDDALSDDRP